MRAPNLAISVSTNIDRATCEMFDIAQDLEEVVDLVPDWSKPEAAKIKTRIIDKMVGWIDA